MCDVNNEARHKYLGILEAEDIKDKEIKEKTRKEYFRRVKIILNSKLNWGGGGACNDVNT